MFSDYLTECKVLVLATIFGSLDSNLGGNDDHCIVSAYIFLSRLCIGLEYYRFRMLAYDCFNTFRRGAYTIECYECNRSAFCNCSIFSALKKC